jgi:hypothetical protein
MLLYGQLKFYYASCFAQLGYSAVRQSMQSLVYWPLLLLKFL